MTTAQLQVWDFAFLEKSDELYFDPVDSNKKDYKLFGVVIFASANTNCSATGLDWLLLVI